MNTNIFKSLSKIYNYLNFKKKVEIIKILLLSIFGALLYESAVCTPPQPQLYPHEPVARPHTISINMMINICSGVSCSV